MTRKRKGRNLYFDKSGEGGNQISPRLGPALRYEPSLLPSRDSSRMHVPWHLHYSVSRHVSLECSPRKRKACAHTVFSSLKMACLASEIRFVAMGGLPHPMAASPHQTARPEPGAKFSNIASSSRQSLSSFRQEGWTTLKSSLEMVSAMFNDLVRGATIA